MQPSVNLDEKVESELLRTTAATLEHTWSWAVSALDLAEAQLVQGQHFNVQVGALQMHELQVCNIVMCFPLCVATCGGSERWEWLAIIHFWSIVSLQSVS